jgi:hypothetical protein
MTMQNTLSIIVLIILISTTIVIADDQSYSITKHITNPGDVIGETSWTDTLMTNGGKLAINKNLNFDSRNQTDSSYNLQSEKILTYNTTNGSHLLGEERYLLNVAGAQKSDDIGYLRCVYTSQDLTWMPAFCNIVETKVSLININRAQISEKGSLRMVGDEKTSAELDYQVAMSPDLSSGSSQAEGSIRTAFTGSILEARDNQTNISAATRWKDTSDVSGTLKNFQKTYAYQSGLRI